MAKILNFTVEEYIRKQIFIAACLCMGNVLCGYSMSWTAPIVPKLQDPEQTPLPDVITLTQASWVGSVFNIAAIIGPYLSGVLSNMIGRKPCLLLAGCINIGGQLLLTFATNLAMIFSGRFFTGFGLTMVLVLNIVYIGEIATPNIRGIILTVTGIFHVFGSLIVISVGPFVSYIVVGYVVVAIGVLHVLAILFIPESPLFYLLKGKEETARQTLINLSRHNVDKDLMMLAENVKEEQEKKLQLVWKELYTVKSNRQSFLITLPLLIFQMCSGVLAVSYFLTTIFESAGSSVEPAIATIIVGVTELVAAFSVPFLIERAGRRTLLLISFVGCCLSMTVLGVYFYLDRAQNPAVSSIGWLPLVTMIVFFVSYGIGLNIVPNAILGEMFRPNVRSIGSSISMTTAVAVGFVSVTTFGYLVEGIGNDFTFWIFALSNAVGLVFTIFFVPETKGMSLVEIQNMLAK